MCVTDSDFTRADCERVHSNVCDPLKKKLGHCHILFSYIIINNRLRKLKFVVLLYFVDLYLIHTRKLTLCFLFTSISLK
jgi:hypothetical protein